MITYTWEINSLFATPDGLTAVSAMATYCGDDGGITSFITTTTDIKPTPLAGLTEAATIKLVKAALAASIPAFEASLAHAIAAQKAPAVVEADLPWEVAA